MRKEEGEMPRAHRFSEKQMIVVLKEAEAGVTRVEEICRRLGINVRTFYKWRAKFGGMEASEASKLRQLTDENRRLKQAMAELMLDNKLLQEIVAKK